MSATRRNPKPNEWRKIMSKKLTIALVATAAIVTIHSASAADPADAIIANEMPKCVNGVGIPGGCFGPNGEIIKAARNVLNDVTRGPGDHNELVGKHGWVRRTFGW
jgi:hypothetical protein